MPAEEGAARVLCRVEEEALRRCPACKEEKPCTREFFQYQKKRGKNYPGYCRPCMVKRKEAWVAANPEKRLEQSRRYHKRNSARWRAYKAIFEKKSHTEEEIDILRRAFAESPPGLESEGERLAYFRGFLAACKRSKDEESRLLEYQDLLFRVASQLDGNLRYMPANDRLSYEEMVSIGYEAVLEVIRKKREPTRNDVAGAIRHRITDAAREQLGYRQNAPRRNAELRRLRSGQRIVVGDDGEEQRLIDMLGKNDAPVAEGEILWDAIKRKTAKRFGPDSRFLDMLALRIQGLSLKEIGEKMGFTESRASQIFAEHQDWMERELAPLAAV